jgi:hypothetical protein
LKDGQTFAINSWVENDADSNSKRTRNKKEVDVSELKSGESGDSAE